MIVRTIATTPSVKALSRPGLILVPPPPLLAIGRAGFHDRLAARLNVVLPADPLDQFVELDGLLGGDEGVELRKSVLVGGFISAAGGIGHAGHCRCSASAGIGCGGCTLDAQAPSNSASGGKARFIIMFGPFIDGELLGGDPLDVRVVGGASGVRGGTVIGDGSRERRLFLGVKLLEAPAFVLPVTSLAFLGEQQKRERERDRDPGNALRIKEAKQGHWGALSASKLAPSRFASTLNRPTGPPARSPTITTIIAAMNPPSDQPK